MNETVVPTEGLVEWGVPDPGSCNGTTFAGIPSGEPGFTRLGAALDMALD